MAACKFIEGHHSTPADYARARNKCGCTDCRDVLAHRQKMQAENPDSNVPMQRIEEEVKSAHSRIDELETLVSALVAESKSRNASRGPAPSKK